jgi:galactokinase
LVRVWSAAVSQGTEISSYELGAEKSRKNWLDYVQGVTWLLRDTGSSFGGFEARIESSVPLGSGLSSSASLTVSLMRALRALFDLDLADAEIAVLGQRVENEFVGARVGIMDPMAASLADTNTALFLDARSLQYERVPLPPGAEFIVIHSGVSHGLVEGDYNTRRTECEQASALLGVSLLRDLGPADLPRLNSLPDILRRRARHVVTEIARVAAAVEALERDDFGEVGRLMVESHLSLRDDYEVSCRELDVLVELALKQPGVLGARMTGAGFGGCTVNLVLADAAEPFAEAMGEGYKKATGLNAEVYVCEASDGALVAG